jgi:hypothetical protein
MKEDKFYYKDGTTSSEYHAAPKQLHRIDGPAIEYANGSKAWYVDGKHHRIDGPACEWADGDKEWWIEGEYYTEEDINIIIEEIRQLPLALRLIDPREWVRNYK